MRIHIEEITADHILLESCCRSIVSRVLRKESFTGYDLTLVLTDNTMLRRLNRRFRGQDRTTDVIAFSLLEGPAHPLPCRDLGDIYISLPRARSQARQYGVTPQEELARLIIHGLLHLLGYDHLKPAEAKCMRRREAEYLSLCRPFYTRKAKPKKFGRR